MADSSTAPNMHSIDSGAPAVEESQPSALTHRTRSGTTQPQADFYENEIKDGSAESDGPNEEELDPIQLPPSTHSLLFSEPVGSLPFWFGLTFLSISFACLGLAFANNRLDVIPFNVIPTVRAAQYLSILVALLMEEEIPTGLYLLRMIPRQSLHQKFPRMRYRKFVCSSCVRIANGYFFLANVLLVLMRATGVIDIFFDVLALQFVQQLDDIAFSLAKIDVFGKRMQRACTATCFRAEFERTRLGRSRKLSIFLKAVYFFNLCVMLAGMGYVTVKQISGSYQHPSLTVDFGNTIWESAWVKVPTWLYQMNSNIRDAYEQFPEISPPGEYEEMVLVYSYFNGVYVRSETKFHDGRPVYEETRKFDRSPYADVVPAEIKYCKEISAWVFIHRDIRKSKTKHSETGCRNWLLRSPDTTEYDILKVDGSWRVWIGAIGKADVSIATNVCKDESDCNLNGACVNGKCNCTDTEDGAQFLGTHCEVRFKDSCQTIVGERWNETFHAGPRYSSGRDELWQEYSRPVFSHYIDWVPKPLYSILIYSGNRWFGQFMEEKDMVNLATEGELFWVDYHAFWYRAYSSITHFVSDPTTGATPVGVDFYWIRQRGGQYGPFGAMYPIQLYNQTGRGYYRCRDDAITSSSGRMLQVPKGLTNGLT